MRKYLSFVEEIMSTAVQTDTQPYHLKVFQMARLIGEVMLEAGAESYRVEDTVRRVLSVTHFSQVEAFTTHTGITISMGNPDTVPITSVQRVSNRTYHLGKIEMANDVSRRFVGGKITVEEATAELERIRKEPFDYKPYVYLPLCACTCGSFAIIFGGNLKDLFATLLVGFLYGVASLVISHMRENTFFGDLLSSFLIGAATVLFTYVIPIAEHPDIVIAGSIMPLVPGMAITNAIRDTLRGDYLSGLARTVESIITAVVIAGGAALLVNGISASVVVPAVTEGHTPWLYDASAGFFQPYLAVQLAASFVSAFTFCVVLKAKRKHLVFCGLLGLCCWTFYQIFQSLGWGVFASTFGATLVTCFPADHLAHTRKAPATVFFAATIINLVPGYGMYKFMYYLISQKYAVAASTGIETIEIATLVAVAIAFHYSLRHLVFAHRKGNGK